mmetsp:Transcript_68527/g.107851  ORF Transcript_68527/g.107851 Transcript_68527/m.107851 type:complete len:208 (+) Transcript_68527:638-1261(+)
MEGPHIGDIMEGILHNELDIKVSLHHGSSHLLHPWASAGAVSWWQRFGRTRWWQERFVGILWILASWIRRVIAVAWWLQMVVTFHLEGLKQWLQDDTSLLDSCHQPLPGTRRFTKEECQIIGHSLPNHLMTFQLRTLRAQVMRSDIARQIATAEAPVVETLQNHHGTLQGFGILRSTSSLHLMEIGFSLSRQPQQAIQIPIQGQGRQ